MRAGGLMQERAEVRLITFRERVTVEDVCLHVRTCDVPAGCGPAHHAGVVSAGDP